MCSSTINRVSSDEISHEILTFQGWRDVPTEFATKNQWLRRGRKVRAGENPTARVVITAWSHATDAMAGIDGREVLAELGDLTLLVDREVLLFRISQTDEANFQARSVAYMEYEAVFLDLARKDSYIRWDPEKSNPRPGRIGNWETITANEYGEKYWQRGCLSAQHIRRHVNGKEIIGVKATSQTRFVALDHDFHGKSREVFLAQSEVLLGVLHGRGTWHYQVAQDEVDGVHYILVLDEPRELEITTATIRTFLEKLDDKHPELGEQARKAGMPTFGEMEIYPRANTGFRLPLCRGYRVLLDRPLPLVTWHEKQVQDVVGYAEWLNNPNRQYMDKADILDYLDYHLAPARAVVPRVSGTSKARKDLTAETTSGLGSLRGCCRQKITDFWRGTFNPNGALNHAHAKTWLALSRRLTIYFTEDGMKREVQEGAPGHCNGPWMRLKGSKKKFLLAGDFGIQPLTEPEKHGPSKQPHKAGTVPESDGGEE